MNSHYDNNSFNISGKYIIVCILVDWMTWVLSLRLSFSWLSITRKPPYGGIVSQERVLSLGRLGKFFSFYENANTFEAILLLLLLPYNISWKRRDTKSRFTNLCTKWCCFFSILSIYQFLIITILYISISIHFIGVLYKLRCKQLF